MFTHTTNRVTRLGQNAEPPWGAWPLMTELVVRAQSAAFVALGGPDFIENPGMIHEYNLLGQTPDYVAGSYNPSAYIQRRTALLASIAELIRTGWNDLTYFMTNTQEALGYAVQDLLEAKSAGGQAGAREVLEYYSNEITAIIPQVSSVAKQLDLGGQLVEEKIRGFKQDFERARGILLGSLKDILQLGINAAETAAQAIEDSWPTIEKYLKYGLYGLGALVILKVLNLLR